MNWPNELGGSHPLATWGNKLLRACKAGVLSQGVGYRLRKTSAGTILQVDPPNPAHGKSTGMVFKGGWSNVIVYNAQEVVFRTPPGGSPGAYIGLSDSIPMGTLPESGAPHWAAWPYPPAGMWG